jgi:hypothetical protein
VFNTFTLKSRVDQMAIDHGLARLDRMGVPPKARNVLEALARMAGTDAKRRDGRVLGISITERSNSLGAGAVKISPDSASGKIRAHKIRQASTAGKSRNAQPPLHEALTIRDGSLEQSNLHNYNVLPRANAESGICGLLPTVGPARRGALPSSTSTRAQRPW